MVKRSLILVGALVLFSGVFVSNVFADGDLDLSITVKQASLQLTVPTTANLDLTPTSAAADFKSTDLTIKVGTNNQTGYTLTMSVPSTDISRIGAASGDPVIGTLEDQSGGYSQNDFTANKWGYKITGNNYFPVTTTLSPSEWITDGPANNVDNTITLASKVNTAIPSGTYKTTLTFQAVANQVPPVSLELAYRAYGKQKVTVGNEQYYKMQDMTSDICNLTAEIPSELQVVDIRDEKIYWIAKLADGHCWMTQNLDLDLETTPNHVLALTSENTDLNTFGSNGYDTNNGYSQEDGVITWEPERNTIPTSSISSTGSISGWTDDFNNPYSIDTGDWYWIGNWKNNGTDTWYNDACTSNPWCNYLSGNENGKFSTSVYAGNGKHGHVGNYYNWSATIASNNSISYNASTLADITTNPQNSICPSGWRLPTVSNASGTDGSTNEFRRLVTLYNTTSNDKALTASPLWFVRGGNVYSSSLNYSGYVGLYWSSTVYGSSSAYYLYFYSSNVGPASYTNRYNGRSVRCIAR